MKDYLVRGMSMDGFVKVVAIRSTEIVRRGAEIHKTTPNATAAFGRVLSGIETVDAICASTPVTDGNGSVAKADQPVINAIRVTEKPAE